MGGGARLAVMIHTSSSGRGSRIATLEPIWNHRPGCRRCGIAKDVHRHATVAPRITRRERNGQRRVTSGRAPRYPRRVARFVRRNSWIDIWLEPQGKDLVLRSRAKGSEPEEHARSSWEARRRYMELQQERFAAGWTRVRDPEREEEVLDEPREPAFEEALRADPGDAATALVYGDWLQQRGHPRGVLVGLAGDAAASFVEAHAETLLGTRLYFAAAETEGERIELRWEHGFLRWARIDGYFDRGDSEDLLFELLRHPSARLLRELEIGCHHPGDQDNMLISAILVNAVDPPPLRRLVIGDFDNTRDHNIDISRAPLGDLARLSEVYPSLEDVELKGTGDVQLGELDLPRARRFVLRTSSLERETLAAIAAAAWPSLVELELWFGNREYVGHPCRARDVAALLAAKLPALRVLRLMNTLLSDEVCELIAASPLAGRLEVIDFGLGTLSAAGASVLARARAAFPAACTIGIAECALSAGAIAELRAAGYALERRSTTPSRDSEAQKRSRYVSVSE